ncbi:prepilin peptidase [Blautia sp. HCP3S3_H10_1]|uniref:prepilin peptidase n=1 Tax=unclassified Blautia TaxID=2648079 RepID=UPI003F9026FC|nr:prepilin peptidase [Clostridia bacterium]
MEQVCILTFLGVNSWKDIRTREVSLLTVGIFGIVGSVRACFLGTIGINWLAAAGIGGSVIVLGIVSKGAVGIGDGLLLLALGTVLSFGELLTTFLLGLLCCSFWGIILLVLPMNGKKKEIPLVPFLLLGYIGGLIY